MNTDLHGFRAWLGPPGPSAFVVLALSVLLLTACAESDPYRRLEAKLLEKPISTQVVSTHLEIRWPTQFKTVQTVTIDFGPVTKTFNALLIIQRPGKFRLQGMTEQGIKIFELAHNEQGDHVLFKADEVTHQTIASISRDIQRVYLTEIKEPFEVMNDGAFVCVQKDHFDLRTRLRLAYFPDVPLTRYGLKESLFVDAQEMTSGEGRLYRFDQYEWAVTADYFIPHVIVLRDSGRESKSYPYKLTIKISDLTVRDTPWPEKTFKP